MSRTLARYEVTHDTNGVLVAKWRCKTLASRGLQASVQWPAVPSVVMGSFAGGRRSHDYDFAVGALVGIKIFGAGHAAAQRLNDRLDFFVAQNLIDARLFDVENFTLERQDRLRARVAPLLGRTTCRITLNQEDFRFVRVLAVTIRQFAGQAAAG